MRGRRWGDWVDTNGDVGMLDRSRAMVLALWPFVASAGVVGVLVMATIVSVGAIQDRDRLAMVATNAAAAARDAKTAAAKAEESASEAKATGDGNRRLLEEIAPCDPGDPPEAPGCVRQARTDAFVADFLAKINSDLARGLALHDANVHRALEELRRRLSAGSGPLPAPAPIQPGGEPQTVTTTTTPAAPPPSTTTTTCPRLPNGRCRP